MTDKILTLLVNVVSKGRLSDKVWKTLNAKILGELMVVESILVKNRYDKYKGIRENDVGLVKKQQAAR